MVYRFPHPVAVAPDEVCLLALTAASDGTADEKREKRKLELKEQQAAIAQEVGAVVRFRHRRRCHRCHHDKRLACSAPSYL